MLLKFKTEIFLLLLAITLYVVSAFFYSYEATQQGEMPVINYPSPSASHSNVPSPERNLQVAYFPLTFIPALLSFFVEYFLVLSKQKADANPDNIAEE
jgi:Ca2+/Na+ antiporter